MFSVCSINVLPPILVQATQESLWEREKDLQVDQAEGMQKLVEFPGGCWFPGLDHNLEIFIIFYYYLCASLCIVHVCIYIYASCNGGKYLRKENLGRRQSFASFMALADPDRRSWIRKSKCICQQRKSALDLGLCNSPGIGLTHIRGFQP